jgi:multiple sugar transport system permease protein
MGFLDMPWVGLDNFITAIQDKFFIQALGVTGTMILVGVAIEFLIGMIIANLLSKEDIRLEPLWIVLIVSPMMLPLIASGSLWRMLFDLRWGAVNAAVMWFGLEPINFLGSKDWALFSVIVVDIWRWTPFVIITLLAGFRSVPPDPKESAIVDGATNFQIFRHITLPMMRNQILVVLLIRSMDIVKTFDIVYALTFGGPGQSSTTTTFYIYRQAFTQFKMGYGASLSWIVFILILVISITIIKILRPKEGSVV